MAEERKDSVRSQFERKIKDCYQRFEAGWLQKSPAELIEAAEEIASVRRMAQELPSSAAEQDMVYLLRFKNPLEVVADAWQDMNGSGAVVDDEMKHMLWEIQDRQAAEADYEMEPEYYGPGQQEPHSPKFTM